MRQLFLIAGIAAVTFFGYAQHRGLTLFGDESAAQQQAAGQRSGGSSRISHK